MSDTPPVRWEPDRNAVHRLIQLADVLAIALNRFRQLSFHLPHPPDEQFDTKRHHLQADYFEITKAIFQTGDMAPQYTAFRIATAAVAELVRAGSRDESPVGAAQEWLTSVGWIMVPHVAPQWTMQPDQWKAFESEGHLLGEYTKVRMGLIAALARIGQTVPNAIHQRHALAVHPWSPPSGPITQEQLLEWVAETEHPRTGETGTDTRKRMEIDPPPPDSAFLFALSGSVYFIRAFGAEGYFPPLAGFNDLERLIRSPGKPVSMFELTGISADTPPVYGRRSSKQPALDNAALAAIRKDVERLRGEVEEAENDVDREDSQKKLDVVLACLSSSTGKSGTPRDLNNPFGNLRSKIADRIATARRKLKDSNPSLSALADHLETPVIRAEDTDYMYDPPAPAPNWIFDPIFAPVRR